MLWLLIILFSSSSLSPLRVADRSLSIDFNELQLALSRFGYNVTPGFIQMLMRKYDPKGGRAVTFDDFIQICILLQSLTGEFKKYDRQQVNPHPSPLI